MHVAVCDIAEGIVLGEGKRLGGKSRPQISSLAIAQ